MEQHNQQLEEEILSGLNTEQSDVFKECIHGNSSVFCTGKGGTGKSRLTESIIKYLRSAQFSNPHQVGVTASTGVAAYLIKGITLHRFAGIGITEDDKDQMYTKASKGKSMQYWTNTDVLIIDEISMISAQLFDNLSYVAQKIRQSNRPFGGIKILMFGDFLQLPPVSRKIIRVPRVFEGDAWKQINPVIFTLNTVMRQDDSLFTEMVSKIRIGDCSDEVCQYFDSLSRDVNYNDGIEPVRLYSLRATTDDYNQSKLNDLNGQLRTYESTDTGDAGSLSQCPAPKTLKMKNGSQVMLTRNIGGSAVNGSIGTVIGFKYVREMGSFQPLVRFIGHDGKSFVMSISKFKWETIAPNGAVTSSRSQVPLILAWAITIHESQGQTIPRLYVDLSRVFEYGQAYVALSRCTDPSSLQVVNFTKDAVKVDAKCLEYYEPSQDNPATNVAPSTRRSWGNNTADTLRMLGHLSIRETSACLNQDSETS